jgi:hypothetical protein
MLQPSGNIDNFTLSKPAADAPILISKRRNG